MRCVLQAPSLSRFKRTGAPRVPRLTSNEKGDMRTWPPSDIFPLLNWERGLRNAPCSLTSYQHLYTCWRTGRASGSRRRDKGAYGASRRLTFHHGQMIVHASISQTLVPPLLSSSECRTAEKKKQKSHGNEMGWSQPCRGARSSACCADLHSCWICCAAIYLLCDRKIVRVRS